jgi:spermidine synthase
MRSAMPPPRIRRVLAVPSHLRGPARTPPWDDAAVGRARVEEIPVTTGTARIKPDGDRPSGFTLLLDGLPQSHVDLADPTYLAFDYVRRLGHVVDLIAPPGEPLNALHLGGGALTLPRYVVATRPRSRQAVIEIDGALVELVRRELPLRGQVRVRVRVGEARAGLTRAGTASADLVVTDVFAGGRVPAHLTSVEMAREVARVLRDGGVYAQVIADGPPLSFARGQTATLREVFGHLVVIAEAGVLRGRRFANLVLVASPAPLPVEGLVRRCAGDPAPARVVEGVDLDRFVAGATPVGDAAAVDSQAPPPPPFSRR